MSWAPLASSGKEEGKKWGSVSKEDGKKWGNLNQEDGKKCGSEIKEETAPPRQHRVAACV